MAVVNLDDAGKAQVVDYAMFWEASPLVDAATGLPSDPRMSPTRDPQQDWRLVCASRNDLTKTYSYTIVRALDTKDVHFDRPIVQGSMHVVYAFADDFSSNFLSYHGANRGSTQIAFLGEASHFVVPKDADGQLNLFFSGFKVQPMDTQYICQTFDVGTSLRQIVAFEPLTVRVSGAQFMHHMLVHLCGSDPAQVPLDKNRPGASATSCRTGKLNDEGVSPLMYGSCRQLAWGWALGGSSFSLPEVAGMPIGGTDSRYIVVELHVNNPKIAHGVPITGGVVLHTASRFRLHNATTLQLGDVIVQGLDNNSSLPLGSPEYMKAHRSRFIPAGVSERWYEAACPSSCTNLLLGPVTAVNSFLHMHQFGKSVFTSRTRDGETKVMSAIANWNFGFQVQLAVNYTIQPGDALSVHCAMDTSKRPPYPSLNWGFASSQEMCMDFVTVFPRENIIKARHGAVPLCGVLYGDSLIPNSPETWGSLAGKVVNVSYCGLSGADPFKEIYLGGSDGLNSLPGIKFYDPRPKPEPGLTSTGSAAFLSDILGLVAAAVAAVVKM